MFRGKAGGARYQGVITRVGTAAFEAARRRLATVWTDVMGRTPATTSDADTIEFLARGEAKTRAYFGMRKREERKSA